MVAVGVGVRKPLPGVERVETPGTRAAGVLPKWQFSHVVEVGKCEVAPDAADGGITIIFVIPKKVLLVMLGP
jgi:hypothetical protein